MMASRGWCAAAGPGRGSVNPPLPVSVMDVLVKHVSDALPSPETNPVNDDNTPFYVTGNTMSEADAQEMGRFWYSVAAGEVRLA